MPFFLKVMYADRLLSKALVTNCYTAVCTAGVPIPPWYKRSTAEEVKRRTAKWLRRGKRTRKCAASLNKLGVAPAKASFVTSCKFAAPVAFRGLWSQLTPELPFFGLFTSKLSSWGRQVGVAAGVFALARQRWATRSTRGSARSCEGVRSCHRSKESLRKSAQGEGKGYLKSWRYLNRVPARRAIWRSRNYPSPLKYALDSRDSRESATLDETRSRAFCHV